MDTTDPSASARPGFTPGIEEKDHMLLLDAARDALEWLRRFQRHAPPEAMFGGEERIARRLSAAVCTCSFELRDCPGCSGGGTVPGPTASPTERTVPTACQPCGGSGAVRVFSYGPPKGSQAKPGRSPGRRRR